MPLRPPFPSRPPPTIASFPPPPHAPKAISSSVAGELHAPTLSSRMRSARRSTSPYASCPPSASSASSASFSTPSSPPRLSSPPRPAITPHGAVRSVALLFELCISSPSSSPSPSPSRRCLRGVHCGLPCGRPCDWLCCCELPPRQPARFLRRTWYAVVVLLG